MLNLIEQHPHYFFGPPGVGGGGGSRGGQIAGGALKAGLSALTGNPIGAILGGAQLLGGILSKKKDPNRQVPTVSAGTEQAAETASQQAAATQAPGRAEAEATLRRGTANVLGQSRRTISDPTKLARLAAEQGRSTSIAAQGLNAQDKAFQRQAQDRKIQAMQQLGREQRFVQQQRDQQYQQRQAARANLVGGGIQTLNNLSNDQRIKDTLQSVGLLG